MSLKISLGILIIAGHATGCATMFGKDEMTIKVTSVPEGAKITTDDESVEGCSTPCELKVPTDRDSYIVYAKMLNMPNQTRNLTKKINAISWFNFIQGPYCFVGWGIDWATGRIRSIGPSNLFFDFQEDLDYEDQPEEEEEAPEKLEEPQNYQRLPFTSSLARIKESYPDEMVAQKIKAIKGSLEGDELWKAIDQVYLIMMEMDAGDEKLDLDEAVSRASKHDADAPKNDSKE